MLDAVLLEKRGIPTATIVTEMFLESGRATAKNLAMPEVPIIPIPHPIANLSPEELKARTEAAFPQVLEALTKPRG